MFRTICLQLVESTDMAHMNAELVHFVSDVVVLGFVKVSANPKEIFENS